MEKEGKTAFRAAHEAELRRLLAHYERQLLGEVVPFWETRVADTEYGGYFNYFDRQGNRFDDKKPGWFAGRTLYTFGALYNELAPKENWLALAAAGRRYMEVYSAGNGRFNRMMSREGKVLEGPTSIFTDHFAVKGLYEFLKATNACPEGPGVQWAKKLTDTLFANVKNPAILAGECPKGYQKHAITFMTLLVACESSKIFESAYFSVVDEYLSRSLYLFANDAHEAQFEYVGENGAPKLVGPGRLVDPGHTLESCWFAMAEAVRRKDDTILKRVKTIINWTLARCYDEACGGFFQHCDVDARRPEAPFLINDYAGVPAAWDDKIWWVQCEALLALGMSALLNEDERHYRYFMKMHDYTENAFHDKTYGEWYSILKRDGTVSCDYKGFELKGAYHVPRCLLKMVLLLRNYLAQE
ncbi:MAG: AGE family epimerase/isomerase [Oscillospiraceae bacterium]